MDSKRFKDILWEHDNDRVKFNAHAHEYFEEALIVLKRVLLFPTLDAKKPTPVVEIKKKK
jgi:hypothetical protein